VQNLGQDEVHLGEVLFVASNVQEDKKLDDFLSVLLLVENYLLDCIKNHVLVF
jgi:hypothetical protein